MLTRPPRIPKAPPIVDSSNTRPLAEPTKAPHFLSEFNLNECCDFRAIPDPPTPQPRNRRRHSMIPNMDDENVHISNSSSTNTNNSTSKRSRKSLCHVPSPMEQRDESPPPATLQVRICVDEDDETRPKRRKKRQSMELPRELVASAGPNIDSLPRFVGTQQNMKDLQALVRGYCKIPRDQRASCQQARVIEESTGYPLLQPIIEDDPQSHAHRRSVLSKMAPIIEEIDKRKADDTAKWEYETGCRVERSKSGKYRYISMQTNNKVGSQEYKRRYMGVIQRESSLRFAKAQQWMEKLHASSKAEDDFEPLPMDAPLVTDSSSDMEDDSFTTTQELDLDLREVLPSSENSTDTSMEICDASVSMDLGEQELRINLESTLDSKAGGRSLKEDVADDDDDKEDIEQELAFQPPLTTHQTKMVPKSVTPTELEMLALPDRDEKSDDPEIAKAEQLLWSRIDEALHEYSQEVLRIQNSRRKC